MDERQQNRMRDVPLFPQVLMLRTSSVYEELDWEKYVPSIMDIIFS
jgi:hypothetical protein